jgi:hypothetical protein
MRRNLTALSVGDTTLEWARVSTGYDGGTGWLHSGIAVLGDGDLLVAHPEGRHLVRIPPSGESVRVHTDLTEMHCLVVAAAADGDVVVWAADNGHRFVHDTTTYGEIREAGRVVELALDGTIVRELADPKGIGPWSPTSVAPVDAGDPDSDVWVADGYGQSLVHLFAVDGTLMLTLDGSASGRPFDCPHGILIRTVGRERILYVADRSNRRIVLFGLDGTYLRTIGADALDSPSSMVDYDGYLVVAELFGALAIFDGDDYVGHIGSTGRDHTVADWPNRTDESGRTVAPRVVNGTFNSPHGITAHDGALYVTEWMIGGRVIALRPKSAA